MSGNMINLVLASINLAIYASGSLQLGCINAGAALFCFGVWLKYELKNEDSGV